MDLAAALVIAAAVKEGPGSCSGVESSHDLQGMHRLRLRPVPMPRVQQQEVVAANDDRGRPPPSQGGDLPQPVAAHGRFPAYHGTSPATARNPRQRIRLVWADFAPI